MSNEGTLVVGVRVSGGVDRSSGDGSVEENARVVVLSGPSGSGKSTIVNRLVEQAPVRLVKAISATTRPPRAGEAEGRDYYFLAPADFEQKRLTGEFLEYAEVFGSGYWYGTLRTELDRAARAGAWALLEIDVQGARRIVEQYPDAVTIFLSASSPEEYEQRLRRRGTESEATIRRRMEIARDELASAGFYRHQVINDNLDSAVGEIAQILMTRENELNAA
jgi:guanylate kinase